MKNQLYVKDMYFVAFYTKHQRLVSFIELFSIPSTFDFNYARKWSWFLVHCLDNIYSCKPGLFFDGTILEKWTERIENLELLSSTKHQPKPDHWKVNKIFDQFCFTGFSILTTLSSKIKDLLEKYFMNVLIHS